MAITGQAQRTWLCCIGERIFCEHSGRGRKESICQRTMDRLQQREDKYIIQSEGAERWFKVQETTEGARVPKDSDLLTIGKEKWKGTKKNLYKSIARGDLTEEAKVWFYFISAVLLPSKHLRTMRRDEAILLYALLKGYKMNVGKIIEKSILSYSKSNCKGLIPHPKIITSLCLLGGVEEEWGKEETYPRPSSLTLTGVTKGPKNGENEKEIEVEEERGYEGCNESTQWESPSQRQQEFQEIQNPNWNASPDLREIHQGQDESSGH